MRLIDADKFNDDVTEYYRWKVKMFNPPTEMQEGYLHAIDEFQRNLENRETVKAIPIEFLREVARDHKNELITVWDNIPAIIENIIKLWEKENGK